MLRTYFEFHFRPSLMAASPQWAVLGSSPRERAKMGNIPQLEKIVLIGIHPGGAGQEMLRFAPTATPTVQDSSVRMAVVGSQVRNGFFLIGILPVDGVNRSHWRKI